MVVPPTGAQTPDESKVQNSSAAFVVGHPFSAIKYARQIRALPNGKSEFIRNERYPVRIARDADGRVMMQIQRPEEIERDRKCNHLEREAPPACSHSEMVVVDPVAHTLAHWLEGELAAHVWNDFLLADDLLSKAAQETSELPDVPPEFDDPNGEVNTSDLGDSSIEGILAHGVRTTIAYPVGHAGNKTPIVLIHEVWTAPEMKLIVRVVDGDPNGVETVWGLEKISLSPDQSLFQPPADYEMQHYQTMNTYYKLNVNNLPPHDFKYLESWFLKIP
jgi:hypothetical protein